jgi:hypothetical protein
MALTPVCQAKNPVSAKNMARRNPVEQLELLVTKQKTVVSGGTVLSRSKDSLDTDEMRGRSKTFFASVNHDLTPVFSPSLFVSRDETKAHLKERPFSYQTRSQMVRLGGRVKLAPWAWLRASFSYGNQSTTYKAPKASNPWARMKQRVYSPDIMLDLNASWGPVLAMLSMGLDRDIARLGGHWNNAGTYSPSTRETTDTGSVFGMLALTQFNAVMPYINGGGARLLKTGLPMKSKLSSFWGGGLMIAGGAVSLGYTKNRSNKHYRSDNFMAHMNFRF